MQIWKLKEKSSGLNNPADTASSGPSCGRWKIADPHLAQKPRSAKGEDLKTSRVSPSTVASGAWTAIHGPLHQCRQVSQWQTPTSTFKAEIVTEMRPHRHCPCRIFASVI